MTTSIEKKNRLIDKLKDKEYRDSYVLSNIYNGIATQIKALREQKEWTQKELGEHADNMKQERVSVLENPNNSSVTINTLQRLASAFDVALMIRFVPFSDLAKWSLNLSPDSFKVKNFDEDEYFHNKPETMPVKSGILNDVNRPKVVNMSDHRQPSYVGKKSALDESISTKIPNSSSLQQAICRR